MANDPNLFCADLDSVIHVHALKMFRDFGKLAGLNYDIKKSKAAFPVLPCEVRVVGGCLNGIQNNEVHKFF